jgi:hypothetical protein
VAGMTMFCNSVGTQWQILLGVGFTLNILKRDSFPSTLIDMLIDSIY